MARQPSLLHALRWDLVLIALLVLGALGHGVLKDPWFRAAEEAIEAGSRPPDRTEGDVLLLLPDAPAAEATEFDELDCSYGWFNSLWQEYGSFATALTRDLSPEVLAGRSVVIVPVRVARTMPETGRGALRDWVDDGGQLIVEQPPEEWAPLTGVATSGKRSRARRITSVEGLGVHGPLRKHLPNVPLAGTLIGSAPLEPHPTGPMLIEVDGQPGLTLHGIGDGAVYTLFFGFSCTITALQQGLPKEAMRFGVASEELVETPKRVADESMLATEVPYADLLERALFLRIAEERPIGRLWPYPSDHAGALMIGHPTPEKMRAALGYADSARKSGYTSTLFVAADRMSSTEAALALEAGADVGLLWVRGATRPPVTRPVGLAGLDPIRQELSLVEQAERLRTTLPPGASLRLVRVEGSLFRNDWATTFRQLSAADLRLDETFGPTNREQWGYLFGTGFPFYPLDERGLPLPLLEKPYLLQASSVSKSRLESLLGNSRAFFNQPITVSLPSNAMAEDPAPGILLAFRDAHDLGARYDHWVTNVGEFLDFLSARRRSVLTSQWSEADRRLTLSVNILGAPSEQLEGGAFPGVVFPRIHDGEEVERVVVDGEEIDTDALTTTGSTYDEILIVEPGRHTVSVFYAAPEAAGAEQDVEDAEGE